MRIICYLLVILELLMFSSCYHFTTENNNNPTVSISDQTEENATADTDNTIIKTRYFDYVSSLKNVYYYTFYDITEDGSPELIVKSGTCEADMLYTIYTVTDNEILNLGSVTASHSWGWGTDNDGIVAFGLHMGQEWAYRIVFENGEVSEKIIYNIDTSDDRILPEIETEPLEYYYPSDKKEEPFKEPTHTPLFDVSKFSDIDTPAVVDAINFEKTDIFDGGAYEFTHKIVLPQIDSTLPGAVALNNKMAGSDITLAERLANTGEPSRHLYRVSYDYSAYDGIIAIQKTSFTGLYQSEGASSSEHYYYDSVNDKELTADEYLAHFGLDADDLNFRARFSSSYLWAEDKYYGGIYYCDTLLCSDESKYSEVMPENGLVYGVAKEANTPTGFKVTKEAVTVYFTVIGYTSYADECRILVENGMPDNPLFFLNCIPTDKLEGKKGIEINIDNGKIKSAKISDGIEIAGPVTITNDCVKALYWLDFDTDNSYAVIDGDIVSNGNGQALVLVDDGEYEMFVHTYYLPEIIKYNECETVDIIF